MANILKAHPKNVLRGRYQNNPEVWSFHIKLNTVEDASGTRSRILISMRRGYPFGYPFAVRNFFSAVFYSAAILQVQ